MTRTPIPTSAREQLLLAREMGHELSVIERTREDFPEADPKLWLSCTCGYRSTVRRSRRALNGVMVWHLGKAIAEGLDGDRVNGRV